jgi:hypothetical protein
MAPKYTPPEQGRAGQIVDSAFILLLVFGALLLPIQLKLTGGGTIVHKPEVLTWATLEQNPTMQAQWEKLGHTPETAATFITERFDYTVRPVPLLATMLVIVAYFIFVLRYSEKEYRDVVREKFGDRD